MWSHIFYIEQKCLTSLHKLGQTGWDMNLRSDNYRIYVVRNVLVREHQVAMVQFYFYASCLCVYVL